MTALLFTILLFSLWALVGFATLILFPPRLRVLQTALIAPAVGVAVVILPVFFLSTAGIPVRDFGLFLCLALVCIAAAIVAFRRPTFPFARLALVLLMLFAALLLTARPMLGFGFDWVSYSNDDMANYCLGALRFLEHGYYEAPNVDALASGLNYSLAYWFMHVAAGVRAGSELMIAFSASISGLNPQQVFMPVIVALHLTLIAATAGLAAGSSRHRGAPVIAAGLMAVSPLSALGTLYQLIGQVGGLSLLCAAVALFYRSMSTRPLGRLVRSNVPGAIVFAALFVWYPELLPFLGLGWLGYLGVTFVKARHHVYRILIPALVMGGMAYILLGNLIFGALQFMVGQAHGGLLATDRSAFLFPYFLVPSGIPALVGITQFTGGAPEPLLSLAILAGGAVLIWLLVKVFEQARLRLPPAFVAAVMMVLATALFFRGNDFGLFKLAMYVQPFFIAIAACGVIGIRKKRSKRVLWSALVCIVAANLVAQGWYVETSKGEGAGALTEIPHASQERIGSEFDALVKRLKKGEAKSYASDAASVVLAKFQALYSPGLQLAFPSKAFFDEVVALGAQDPLYDEYRSRVRYNTLELSTKQGNNRFLMRDGLDFEGMPLISVTKQQSIFNGAHPTPPSDNYFYAQSKPENHLVFVHSELGQHYYFGHADRIAYYQLESDPLVLGESLSALGRHLVFMVLGATARPRLMVELSSTLTKQFDSKLPPAEVQGVALRFMGRGTGRVISAPLELTTLDGESYLAMDMGREGQRFGTSKGGLMMLYGRDIPQDRRLVTTFGRDISLISERDYQTLRRPAAIRKFPADFSDKALEYSGIYEDGWISERAFFVLRPEQDSKTLTVGGMIPLIDSPDFRSIATVSIDGRIAVRKELRLGEFRIEVPVTPDGRDHRIEVAFDRYQRLPGDDGRPVAAKIDFLGYSKDLIQ